MMDLLDLLLRDKLSLFKKETTITLWHITLVCQDEGKARNCVYDGIELMKQLLSRGQQNV
jgi:hypothetical protein